MADCYVFSGCRGNFGLTYYYGYEIDGNEHTGSKIKIKASSTVPGIIGVWDLTGVGQMPIMPTVTYGLGNLELYPEVQEWFSNINSILTDSKRRIIFQPLDTSTENEITFDTEGIEEFAILVNSWNERAVSSVRLVWSDDIIEQRTVTKELQVPYEVPVQVEKQRTVMQTQKVPFWEAIFD